MPVDLNSNQFNDAQWQAIIHEGGHLLIVAGPGTGKTHTLTFRVLNLFKKLKSNQKILAITFTNKASDEMLKRISAFGLDPNAIQIGTFHSFCLKFLREFEYLSGLPKGFKVISPEEELTLLKSLWPNETKQKQKARFEQIMLLKSTQLAEETREDVIFFNQKLRGKGYLDYDDILWEAYHLLRNNEPLLERVHEQYPFIFVDEYQDINPVQYALLKELVGKNTILTVIGDPHQAIYGFRGGSNRYFEDFKADFSNSTLLTLKENYRSSQNILTASSQVISKLPSQKAPDLIAKIYQEGRLTFHETPTDKAEAEYVVHTIEKLVGGTSMFSQDSGRVDDNDHMETSFADIAILYRLNSQRFALQQAFDRSGIPYEVCGIKTEEKSLDITDDIFLQRPEHIEVNAEKVSLMTIHSAKGLEFPVVFMVGCEEGLLPLKLEELEGDEEEERRLFYVGMTRAKRRLYLVYCKRRSLYGKIYQNPPSPFLSDIEEKLKAYEEKVYLKPSSKNKVDTQLTLFE